MTHFPQPHPTHRATRIQLGDFAPALVKLDDGQHTKARIQAVSVNGGLLQLAKALAEGDLVEVAFQTLSGPVHGMAEMLHPRQVSPSTILQGFRFVALDDADHQTLTFTVTSTAERNLLFGQHRH
jgi:PilZ domain-containing protein